MDYISRPPDPRADNNSFYQILHAYLRLELLSDGEIWTTHKGVYPYGLVVQWGGV
jgi:hypothetical protein